MIRLLRSLPRYTAVATVCAALHNAILIILDALSVHFLFCQAASAAVLLPVGFVLQSCFTFEVEKSWLGFGRYSAALITNFPVALAVLWLIRDVIALPMWVAAPASTAVLFVWNYTTSWWALGRPRTVAGSVDHG